MSNIRVIDKLFGVAVQEIQEVPKSEYACCGHVELTKREWVTINAAEANKRLMQMQDEVCRAQCDYSDLSRKYNILAERYTSLLKELNK